MANAEIQELEHTIFELTAELNELRKSNGGDEVRNYSFATINGETDLLSMFGEYIREQTVMDDSENMPGAVVYERNGDKITRKNSCVFGPGDIYCSMWSLLGLAGLGGDDWTPQYA